MAAAAARAAGVILGVLGGVGGCSTAANKYKQMSGRKIHVNVKELYGFSRRGARAMAPGVTYPFADYCNYWICDLMQFRRRRRVRTFSYHVNEYSGCDHADGIKKQNIHLHGMRFLNTVM